MQSESENSSIEFGKNQKEHVTFVKSVPSRQNSVWSRKDSHFLFPDAMRLERLHINHSVQKQFWSFFFYYIFKKIYNVSFSDALKLFRIIKQLSECSKLQENVARVMSWCSWNDLVLNTNKFNIISLCRNQCIDFSYVFSKGKGKVTKCSGGL